MKRPWKWRVPRTKSREKDSRRGRTGWPQGVRGKIRETHRLVKTAKKMLETTSVEKARSRKVYVPKDLKTCSHEYIRRGNEKEARKAWDGRDEVRERSKQAIWIRYKNGSTDEIAIDETRLLQSGKAFAW